MKRSIALVLTLVTTGCMQGGDKYPSLALRTIETRSEADPAPPPSVEAKVDAALDGRLATLNAALAKANADFTVAASRTAAASRKPGAQAIGSDPWVAAQAALADTEASRGESLGIVTDLERLSTDRGAAGDPPYPSLDTARTNAQSQLDTETAQIV